LKSRYDNSSGINVTIESYNSIHQNNNKITNIKFEVTQNTDAIAIVDEPFDSEQIFSQNVHSIEFSNSISSFHDISVETSLNESCKTKLEIIHNTPYHGKMFKETLGYASQTNENVEINFVNSIS